MVTIFTTYCNNNSVFCHLVVLCTLRKYYSKCRLFH